MLFAVNLQYIILRMIPDQSILKIFLYSVATYVDKELFETNFVYLYLTLYYSNI